MAKWEKPSGHEQIGVHKHESISTKNIEAQIEAEESHLEHEEAKDTELAKKLADKAREDLEKNAAAKKTEKKVEKPVHKNDHGVEEVTKWGFRGWVRVTGLSLLAFAAFWTSKLEPLSWLGPKGHGGGKSSHSQKADHGHGGGGHH